MRISLASGVNIPLAVSALQKQIKQYITSCSGVDVREVRVMVETNNSLAPFTGSGLQGGMMADVTAAARAGEVASSLQEAAQNATLTEPEPLETHEKLPLHQRLFHREEKPQIVPEPPKPMDDETVDETPAVQSTPEEIAPSSETTAETPVNATPDVNDEEDV
jgi:hypothetical protein